MWGDDEADIACIRILGNGAIERYGANTIRNCIGKQHAEHTACGGNDQSFRKKLKKNVALARTQSFFHANLAGSLGDGDQHDVHESYAADAQRNSADKGQKNFQSHDDDAELLKLFLRVKHHQRPLIGGLEVVSEAQRLSNRRFKLVMVEAE